jgi:phosphomannomutase
MNRKEEIQELKQEYFKLIEKFTPEEIKKAPIFDLQNSDEFELILNKELIEKLKLEDWLKNYEKEAKVSTGGIRGPQNVLYYWDSRFPINQMGVALATIGKALVLKEDINGEIHKITAGEVRYNTQNYINLISRIQASLEIHSHLPFNRQTVPVWMVSFLIFMLDYNGGEFVTSSHAISSKIATKDLDDQGSQFLPEMSLRFIEKIKGVIKQAKENPKGYVIKLSSVNNNFIKEDFNGYDMYVDYLKRNVAKEANINLIKKAQKNGFKIMYDAVGGCMYKTMSPILEKLEILDVFDWRNKEEDPFFHGIGKIWKENQKTGKKEFFDLSCDFCLIDVAKSANFEEDLKDKPVGYIVLITDPDGDRLVIGQIESKEKIGFLKNLGMDYIKINEDKIFVVYSPTYSFFLIMDYYMKQLKQEGIWSNHPRFIVATTPSSRCWDEWAENNNIKVIITPVGMKEIATVIKKVEKQILENPNKEVVLENIFGEKINLGKEPRMVFGGEESGGMITGLEDFIESEKGRKAIAMREKSAGEASVIATALAAHLFENKKLISEQIEDIFKENNIKSTQYIRDDIIYYNESEPDPIKLAEDKLAGEAIRDKTDTFYLSITLALRDKKITIEKARKLLEEIINDLDFSRLIDIKFTGDASYFQFDNNFFVQVRRSGTDAKMRGYACGPNREDCVLYLDKLLHYNGERTNLYREIIPQEYQENIYSLSQKIYKEYLYNGL